MLGNRANSEHLEAAVDADCRGTPLDRDRKMGLQLGVGKRPLQRDRLPRLERHDDGVRRRGGEIGPHEGAVQVGLPGLAAQHDQLAVEAVQRAETQIAVLEDLAQRHVALEGTGQQRLHSRGLKQLVRGVLGAQLAVAQQFDLEGAEELELAHLEIKPSSADAARAAPPESGNGSDGTRTRDLCRDRAAL